MSTTEAFGKPVAIKLTHLSLNTGWAQAFGFVIKLEYYFPDIEQPELEIFRDTEEARANDWRIYGVKMPKRILPNMFNFPSPAPFVMFRLAFRFCVSNSCAVTTASTIIGAAAQRLCPAMILSSPSSPERKEPDG